MARHVLRWGGWAVLIAIALNSYEVEAERVGGVVELGSDTLGAGVGDVPVGATPKQAESMTKGTPETQKAEIAAAAQASKLSKARAFPVGTPFDPIDPKHQDLVRHKVEDVYSEYRDEKDPEKANKLIDKVNNARHNIKFFDRLNQAAVDTVVIKGAENIKKHRQYAIDAATTRSTLLDANKKLNYGLYAMQGKQEFDAEVDFHSEMDESNKIDEAVQIQQDAQSIEDSKTNMVALQKRLKSVQTELAGIKSAESKQTKAMARKKKAEAERAKQREVEIAQAKMDTFKLVIAKMRNETKMAYLNGDMSKYQSLRASVGRQKAFLSATQRGLDILQGLAPREADASEEPDLIRLAREEVERVRLQKLADEKEQFERELAFNKTQANAKISLYQANLTTLEEELQVATTEAEKAATKKLLADREEKLEEEKLLADLVATAPGGNGTAGNATAGNRTAGNGTAGNGTAGNGTAGNGTAGNSTLPEIAPEQQKVNNIKLTIENVTELLHEQNVTLKVLKGEMTADEAAEAVLKLNETKVEKVVEEVKEADKDKGEVKELENDIEKTKDREQVAEQVLKEQKTAAKEEHDAKEAEKKKEENEPSPGLKAMHDSEKIDIEAANITANKAVKKTGDKIATEAKEVAELEEAEMTSNKTAATMNNLTKDLSKEESKVKVLKANETKLEGEVSTVAANTTAEATAEGKAAAEAASAGDAAAAAINNKTENSADGQKMQDAEQEEAAGQEVVAKDTKEKRELTELDATKIEETEENAELAAKEKQVGQATVDLSEELGQSQSQEKKIEKALKLLDRAAGNLPTVAAFSEAETQIKKVRKAALEVKDKLQQQAAGLKKAGESPKLEDTVAAEALDAASDGDAAVQKENTEEMLRTAKKDLATSESKPTQETSIEPDESDEPADSLKVRELEKENVQEKDKALQSLEAAQEAEKLKSTATAAFSSANLDSLLAKLRSSTDAVAAANQEANNLKSKFVQATDETEKKEIGLGIKEQREKAASLHLKVERLITKVAQEKISLRTKGAKTVSTDKVEQEKVQVAEKQLEKAEKQEEGDTNDAVKSAASEMKAASNQVSATKLEQEQNQKDTNVAEAKMAALQKKAEDPKTAVNPAEQAKLQAEVATQEKVLAEVSAKSDKAAANVASAEEERATADKKEVKSLDSKVKEEESEAKDSKVEGKMKAEQAAAAADKVAKAVKNAAEAKSALNEASNPAQAAALSQKLAAAEMTASAAEEASHTATSKATEAATKEQVAEGKIQESKAEVAAVESPYRTKAKVAKSRITKTQYADQLKKTIAKSGMPSIASPKWIQAEAAKMADADLVREAEQQKEDEATAKAVKDKPTPRQVPANISSVKKVQELGDSNGAFQKQLNLQVERTKLDDDKSKISVADAFKTLSKAAAQNQVSKPMSSSSTLKSVVDAAVKEGGTSGVLSSMMHSLEDSESRELGDSMTQSESKDAEKHLLDGVFDKLGAPESLLQMSKWSWQGDIPADGIPHAPNTPHSTSGDELFKDAMGKAEKMAGGTTATAAAQSDAVSTAAEKAAPEAASKGAEKQAAVEIKDSKKQIEEDTKAMNGAKDQKEALRFAKKIEDSKKALDTSEKKEVKAQTQEAENKIAKEENKLVVKEEAAGAAPSSAGVEETKLAGEALKNAVDVKAEAVASVNKDAKKSDALQGKIDQSTSASQVDVLTDKLQTEKVKATTDKAEMKKAVLGVENAGIAEIIQGVKAGAIKGDEAVKLAKKVVQDKVKVQLGEVQSQVQAKTAKVAEDEASIAENEATIVKVKQAAKAANNPEAAGAAETSVLELKQQVDKEKTALATAKAAAKSVEVKAADVVKKTEAKEEQSAAAAAEAKNSVQRSEKAESKALDKAETAVKKEAVKLGAEQGAAKALKKQEKTSKAEAKKTTSVLLKDTAKKNEKEAKTNEEQAEGAVKQDQKKLERDEQAGRSAKDRLVAKITQAVAKVASAAPSKGSPLDRQKKREVTAAAQEVEKQSVKETKDQGQAKRVHDQVDRRKERLQENDAKLMELEAEKKQTVAEINSDAKSADSGASATDDIKGFAELQTKMKASKLKEGDVDEKLVMLKEQNSKVKVALKKSDNSLKEAKSKLEGAELKKQKDVRALKRAEASKAETKAAETADKLKSQGKGLEAKALEIEAARKSDKQKQSAEEAKDKEEIQKAKDQETVAKEKVAPLVTEKKGGDATEALANTLLTKAGFQPSK